MRDNSLDEIGGRRVKGDFVERDKLEARLWRPRIRAVAPRVLTIRPCLRRPWPGGILDQDVKLLARSAGGRPVDNVAFRTESGKVENADARANF